MTDYGQDLQLGLFPTPDAGQPHRVLELAQLADLRGLDLVTVQDHPYQARHLDALTLLATIAARTSSVRVAPNVANLPLRPPVVLARSIATLDLLSGGRAELGLGTGAFWDAIVAAGGERRTGPQAVDALVEAIAVIRQTWGGAGNRTVAVSGEHYRIKGLHAGPAPAHDIEIWLGAYRPRMLRITGQLADGWLPSLGYLELADLPALQEQLDEAALAAGRHPADVRRMLNISGSFGSGGGFLQGDAADWAEQLAELTLTTGTSCYILGTDDPDDLIRFADEVAPDLRERVAAERARRAAGPDEGTARPDQSPAGPATTAAPSSPSSPLSPNGSAPGTLPTEDDGTRLTGELEWDESRRPATTGGDDPSAGLSTEQLAAPRHLVDVHNALRAELAQVRDIAAQVLTNDLDVAAARSEINRMTMRQNNWTLGAHCESYCRIVAGHHGLEDRSVFPHLRRSDPSLAPVIDRLVAEHHVIAEVLDRLDHALVALVGDEPAGRRELRHTIDLLTDTLLSHLAWEEKALWRPLAEHAFY